MGTRNFIVQERDVGDTTAADTRPGIPCTVLRSATGARARFASSLIDGQMSGNEAGGQSGLM